MRSPEVKFYLTMKLLHPSTHKPVGNIVFWKKNLLEIQLSVFHKMGSAYIHICLTSTTGKITYNRGIFRIEKDSSHSMAPCSTQPLIQPFYPADSCGALCVRPWEADGLKSELWLPAKEVIWRGDLTHAEQLLIRGGKSKELCPLVVIPCRV